MRAGPISIPVAYHAGAARKPARACVDLRTGEAVDYPASSTSWWRAPAPAWLASRIEAPASARGRDHRPQWPRQRHPDVRLHERVEGTIYTPLNWRLTSAELAGLSDDARPAMLVYEDRIRGPGARGYNPAAPGCVAVNASGGAMRAQVDACEPAPAQARARRTTRA